MIISRRRMTACFGLRHSAARVGCSSARGDEKAVPCVATHRSLGERASIEERGQPCSPRSRQLSILARPETFTIRTADVVIADTGENPFDHRTLDPKIERSRFATDA